MKKNKLHWPHRIAVIGLAAILSMTLLLAGCGGGGEETSLAPETTAMSTEETTEATTEETTPAPTEPPTLDVSQIRVGMIFLGEEADGSLLSQSLSQEMKEAATAIGMEEHQILVQYHSRDAEWTQIEDSILDCVGRGCQLILGCAREYDGIIAAIAEEYPEVMFACVGSQLYNGMNSGTFTMDVSVAQYLSGAMAGMETDGRVGFVAAKGNEDEIVTQAVNAFAYGVWSTNQDAIVDVAVIGKWFLPGAEEKGVNYLRDLGCDQIGSYTDSSIGSLEYLWREYFSLKLNQVIEKQVIGETWVGDYFGHEVLWTHDMIQLPDYVLDQVAEWAPEVPEETQPEETSEESTEEMTSEETVEETTAPYEIPEIRLDPDTGYLTNVRVHRIEWIEE